MIITTGLSPATTTSRDASAFARELSQEGQIGRCLGHKRHSEGLSGQSHLGAADSQGVVLSATEEEIAVPSNSSRVVLSEELELADKDPADRFIAASLYEGENLISQNMLFIKRFKHIELPEPTFKVKTEAAETDKRTFRITVSSPVFAKALNLKLPSDLGRCSHSDNYFDLLPNAEKTVLLRIEERVSPEELEGMLHVSSL